MDTPAKFYTNYTHLGYMAGLQGQTPDPKLERSDEYATGWLHGSEDRAAGITAERFQEHPANLKRGSMVKIPKGTTVSTIYHGVRQAGRDYLVKIHDVYPVVPAHLDYRRTFSRPTPARVIWPGKGGYWSEAAVTDVVVESEAS